VIGAQKHVRAAWLISLAGTTLTAMTCVRAAPPPIDACALLDAQEIGQVIGAAVEAGSRHDTGLESNGAWSSSCLWTLEADKGRPRDPNAPLGGNSFVILNAIQWPIGSHRAHEFLDSFRKAAADGILPHALSSRDFGDDALWWGDGLAVRKEEVSFGISVHLRGAPARKPGELEERLAALVLRRIDQRNALLEIKGRH
jgi:hypothetical protein